MAAIVQEEYPSDLDEWLDNFEEEYEVIEESSDDDEKERGSDKIRPESIVVNPSQGGESDLISAFESHTHAEEDVNIMQYGRKFYKYGADISAYFYSHTDHKLQSLTSPTSDVCDRKPKEIVRSSTFLLNELDVLHMTIEMLLGITNELYNCEGSDIFMTHISKLFSIEKLSSASLLSILQWFTDLGSALLTCRRYVSSNMRKFDIVNDIHRVHVSELLGTFDDILNRIESQILLEKGNGFDSDVDDKFQRIQTATNIRSLVGLYVLCRKWEAPIRSVVAFVGTVEGIESLEHDEIEVGIGEKRGRVLNAELVESSRDVNFLQMHHLLSACSDAAALSDAQLAAIGRVIRGNTTISSSITSSTVTTLVKGDIGGVGLGLGDMGCTDGGANDLGEVIAAAAAGRPLLRRRDGALASLQLRLPLLHSLGGRVLGAFTDALFADLVRARLLEAAHALWTPQEDQRQQQQQPNSIRGGRKHPQKKHPLIAATHAPLFMRLSNDMMKRTITDVRVLKKWPHRHLFGEERSNVGQSPVPFCESSTRKCLTNSIARYIAVRGMTRTGSRNSVGNDNLSLVHLESPAYPRLLKNALVLGEIIKLSPHSQPANEFVDLRRLGERSSCADSNLDVRSRQSRAEVEISARAQAAVLRLAISEKKRSSSSGFGSSSQMSHRGTFGDEIRRIVSLDSDPPCSHPHKELEGVAEAATNGACDDDKTTRGQAFDRVVSGLVAAGLVPISIVSMATIALPIMTQLAEARAEAARVLLSQCRLAAHLLLIRQVFFVGDAELFGALKLRLDDQGALDREGSRDMHGIVWGSPPPFSPAPAAVEATFHSQKHIPNRVNPRTRALTSFLWDLGQSVTSELTRLATSMSLMQGQNLYPSDPRLEGKFQSWTSQSSESTGISCVDAYFSKEDVASSVTPMVMDKSKPYVSGDGDGRVSILSIAGGISIQIMHGWPLNEVLSSDTVTRYNTVLRFLLQITTAKWAAEAVWKMAMASKLSVPVTDYFSLESATAKANTKRASVSKGGGTVNTGGIRGGGSRRRVSPLMAKVGALRRSCFAGLTIVLHALSGLHRFYMHQIHSNLPAEFSSDVKSSPSSSSYSSVSALKAMNDAVLAGAEDVTGIFKKRVLQFVHAGFTCVVALKEAVEALSSVVALTENFAMDMDEDILTRTSDNNDYGEGGTKDDHEEEEVTVVEAEAKAERRMRFERAMLTKADVAFAQARSLLALLLDDLNAASAGLAAGHTNNDKAGEGGSVGVAEGRYSGSRGEAGIGEGDGGSGGDDDPSFIAYADGVRGLLSELVGLLPHRHRRNVQIF